MKEKMHREVFKSERLIFGDTYADIFGKKAENELVDNGTKVFLEIARRLPDSFDDMEEKDVVEMFRKAHLFLGLKTGFASTERGFYFTAKTREELEDLKRERDKKILLELCPTFPMEHLDTFYSLYTYYKMKMRRRKSLREYFGESETPEKKAEREEHNRVMEEKHAEEIRAEKARLPNGLEILAFFSQPKELRDILTHFPIQLDYLCDFVNSDFEDAAKYADVTEKDVYFAYERYDAYRKKFEDFTTSENGAPCGKIVYLRAEKDEGVNLLEGGKSVFVLHEVKEGESLSEEEEEELFKSHIEKAFSEGYSFVHCYLITEPISSLPLTISENYDTI